MNAANEQAKLSVQQIGHYIGGVAVDPASGRFKEVFNPATGQVTGAVALASIEEVDAAVQSAKAAFAAWSETAPLKRARILFKFKELLNKHHDELAMLITREHGKCSRTRKGRSCVASKWSNSRAAFRIC
jgi:malonate-semialdehyde dehydrogenase (acetylating)/methylmalonate-semialdehyde dehydrogenase